MGTSEVLAFLVWLFRAPVPVVALDSVELPGTEAVVMDGNENPSAELAPMQV